jgi:hypothetical protein
MRNKLLATAAVVALIGGTTLAMAQTGGSQSHSQGGAQMSSGGATGGGAAGGTVGQGGSAGESNTMGHTQTPPAGIAQNKPGTEGREGPNKSITQNQQGTEGQTKGMSQTQQGTQGQTKGLSQNQKGTEGQTNGMSESQDHNGATQRGVQDETRPGEPSGTQQRTGQTDQNRGLNQENTAQEKTGAGHAAQVTDEQRTKIRGIIGRDRNVARVNHVDFNISVGTVVPRDVHFAVLPPEVVTIVPEYRGFDYVIVGEQLLIIDPHSLEIVAILPA